MSVEVLYEDNHLIAVNKKASQLVQGDRTGDVTLGELTKNYLKKKYDKPGNVFLGIIHRLDRPTSGVVVFAKTSKALARMNIIMQNREVEKTYWAITAKGKLPRNNRLEHYLIKDQQKNKSKAFLKEIKNSKKAILRFNLLQAIDNYQLLRIELETGRHHQIRVQLSSIGFPIKGDLKYGFKRPNKDASISLHARSMKFNHPVSKELVKIVAPVPEEKTWGFFTP